MPNNDIAKPRRLRIEKAVQYGATWLREWQDTVTHVVVDKELNFDDVLKGVGKAQIPVGPV